eukprot:1365326-Amorphochlora_amoeboformis.AAC.1
MSWLFGTNKPDDVSPGELLEYDGMVFLPPPSLPYSLKKSSRIPFDFRRISQLYGFGKAATAAPRERKETAGKSIANGGRKLGEMLRYLGE